MKKTKLIWDEGSLDFILDAIGLVINNQGYVKDCLDCFVLDVDNKPFKASELIGIVNKKFITKESQLLSIKL